MNNFDQLFFRTYIGSDSEIKEVFHRHFFVILEDIIVWMFFGIVREMEKGAALSGLGYEAHESMARKHLERIFAELAEAHPVEEVVFIHRLGWVPVGEASMFVRVLSAHRGEALFCCGAAIDRMKQDVPIWKRITLPPDERSR